MMNRFLEFMHLNDYEDEDIDDLDIEVNEDFLNDK